MDSLFHVPFRPKADATIDGKPYARVDEVEPSIFPGRVRVKVQGEWSTVGADTLVPVLPLTPAPRLIPWDEAGYCDGARKREDGFGVRVYSDAGYHFFDPDTPAEDIDVAVRASLVAHYTAARDAAAANLKRWE